MNLCIVYTYSLEVFLGDVVDNVLTNARRVTGIGYDGQIARLADEGPHPDTTWEPVADIRIAPGACHVYRCDEGPAWSEVANLSTRVAS